MKSKRRTPRPVRIVKRDGRLNIEGLGAWYSYWRDPYHLLLTIPWTGFLALIVAGYFATNFLFALVYLAGGNCIANARPGSLTDDFFFSVQTLATIGYGTMYPRTYYANSVMTIEVLVGMLGVAMATGLAFARFARPTARVLFSRVAVIAPQDGVPTLMFRAANERRNTILEAQMQVRLACDEVTQEGHFMRRFYELKLVRSHSPLFALSWTVMHRIDENSPLYGATPESLAAAEAELLVTMNGIDETVVQTIHTRHTYAAQELLWNMNFVDILFKDKDGQRCINYTRFHDVTAVQSGSESARY
ncbi:MAG: ATP-sensitive inward rectifier potassium channel 10 [Chroococcidiopsidaceae cyanobacterium CP_BM_RX_35]|nr:ATP-sensitive inward rectifier potassium channel 10 [Chroococcidiopsidaceae cyanobacterium CP_BM_RX_35]